MLSPLDSGDARSSAAYVDTSPIPPRKADAYRPAILRKNGDKIACATVKITTAVTTPHVASETPAPAEEHGDTQQEADHPRGPSVSGGPPGPQRQPAVATTLVEFGREHLMQLNRVLLEPDP